MHEFALFNVILMLETVQDYNFRLSIQTQLQLWQLILKASELFSFLLKFIYSEKATKVSEIFTLLLSHVVPSKVTISQNFMAFSEYINFTLIINSVDKNWAHS